MVAYASINKKGEPRLQTTPPFNDGAALSETHDTEHIRNDSIRNVGQSKANTNTDTRVENSHDDDRGITGFFKDGNQYKELHEDMVIIYMCFSLTHMLYKILLLPFINISNQK